MKQDVNNDECAISPIDTPPADVQSHFGGGRTAMLTG